MKKSISIITTALAAVFCCCTLVAGCKKGSLSIDNGDILQDMDVAPTQTAAYEQYSREAIESYLSVASKHKNSDGEIDTENSEVQQAARAASAKLYAYACYNERTLDNFVFFANQEGETSLSTGSGTVVKQEYFLRVNENPNSCGYRYHYTIKKATDSSGTLSAFKGLIESARIRITDKTNLLYRFEGNRKDIVFGPEHEGMGIKLLQCKWAKGKDWAKPDAEMKKSEYIAPDKIEEDIVNHAGEDNITIRGNINILAKDIVKSAVIIETETNDKQDGYLVVMEVDTEVANKDTASLKMMRRANDSDNCKWKSSEDSSGLTIVFRIWNNGLFRLFTITEQWTGKMYGNSGTVDSITTTYYSYSARDCDMTKYLAMIA